MVFKVAASSWYQSFHTSWWGVRKMGNSCHSSSRVMSDSVFPMGHLIAFLFPYYSRPVKAGQGQKSFF